MRGSDGDGVGEGDSPLHQFAADADGIFAMELTGAVGNSAAGMEEGGANGSVSVAMETFSISAEQSETSSIKGLENAPIRWEMMRFVRVAFILSHLVNMGFTISVFVWVPRCCGKRNAPAPGIGVVFAVLGIACSLYNMRVVAREWPEVHPLHYVLTSGYDFCVLITTVLLFVEGISSGPITSVLTFLAAGYGLFISMPSSIRFVWRRSGLTPRTWCTIAFLAVIHFINNLGLMILSVMLISSQVYSSLYFFDSHMDGYRIDFLNRWNRNSNQEFSFDSMLDTFYDCTANFAQSSSHSTRLGGTVTEYCDLYSTTSSYTGGGCCHWDQHAN